MNTKACTKRVKQLVWKEGYCRRSIIRNSVLSLLKTKKCCTVPSMLKKEKCDTVVAQNREMLYCLCSKKKEKCWTDCVQNRTNVCTVVPQNRKMMYRLFKTGSCRPSKQRNDVPSVQNRELSSLKTEK